ncbi:S16 family serine protease [Acidobacteriota bacterium]
MLLPAQNEKDLKDIPEDLSKGLRFVFINEIDEAVKESLGK